MRKLITSIALVFACVSISCGQAPAPLNKAKLDSLIDIVGSKDKAMMSIALMQDGKHIYSKSVGYADLGANKIPATLETKYRIGSISKVFTGVMVFQLIQEGKLKLTTPLSDFYPSVTNATKITVANLLDHSSGLFNITSAPDYMSKLDKKVTQADQLAEFNHAAVFEPGAKHDYSNTNFILLGFIIEKLDKKSYAAAVKTRITDKIGLKNTYYGGKINTANKEAKSYKWSGSWVPDTETDMSIPGGAGAMVSTPRDLVEFFNALFHGKLINQSSLDQMKTVTQGYGKALFPMSFEGKEGFGHTGGIDGFQSQAAYFPKENLVVALIGNGVNTSLNNIGKGALSIAFNMAYQIPDFKELTLKTEELDKYLGIYATDKMPLKITITKKENVLFAQATGQSAFPLTPKTPNTFSFEAAGITLIFDAPNSQMTLNQGGNNFIMTKEK